MNARFALGRYGIKCALNSFKLTGGDKQSKRVQKVNVNVKVHTLDIAPLRSESPPQKRSGMARVLRGFHSFTCTLTRSSAMGMSHACLCLPSRSWYSFTDPGGMEG